jgi:GT2 family glycosyltransferase
MQPPKILVGCPVSEHHKYSTEEYLEAIKNLTYSNYDIYLVDNSTTTEFFKELQKQVPSERSCAEIQNVKEKIAATRNVLRKKVLENYDYFLSLEQDVIPPKNVIEQLLQHKKAIVSGVYYSPYPVMGKQQLFPVLYRWLKKEEQEHLIKNKETLRKINPELYKELEKNKYDFTKVRVKVKPQEVEEAKLMKVKQCGLGCVLIKKEVLEKIEFRIDKTTDGFDDATFCDDTLEKGYELYVDTRVKCKHLIKNRPWKWEEIEK